MEILCVKKLNTKKKILKKWNLKINIYNNWK